MAPSKKGGKENSQEVEEIGRASWSKENIMIFCELCMELVDKSKGKNGGTISQRIRWKDIVPAFQNKTNLAWSREQLKHKYDGLKVRWALWKKLKGKETGLGWDHEKGTIAASDEWWMKKIEEDAKFKQFRDKGIEPELENKMDQLFGGHVARGDDIITPNMDPLSTPMEEDEDRVYIPSQPHIANIMNQPSNIENNTTSILGPEVSAWQELWRDDSPLSTPSPASQGLDGGGNGKGKRVLDNFSSDPNKRSKINGRKKMGSTAMMYEKLDTMLELIISEKKAREVERLERKERRQAKEINNKNASVDDGAPSVPDALAKICALPHFDPMHPVFIFACELVEDPQKRMILFGLPNDDSRAQWLTYLYEKYGKK